MLRASNRWSHINKAGAYTDYYITIKRKLIVNRYWYVGLILPTIWESAKWNKQKIIFEWRVTDPDGDLITLDLLIIKSPFKWILCDTMGAKFIFK